VAAQLLGVVKRVSSACGVLSAKHGTVSIRIGPSVSPELVEAVEYEGQRLGITNFGLSFTTMEDVFLRSASLVSHADEGGESVPIAQQLEPEVGRPSVTLLSLSGQLKVLTMKKVRCSLRDRRMFCYQVVVPVVFIAAALLVMMIPWPHEPPLRIDAALGGASEVVYSSPQPQFHGFSARGPVPCKAGEHCATAIADYLFDTMHAHEQKRYIAFAPYTNSTCKNIFTGEYEQCSTAALLHNASAAHSLPQGVAAVHSTYLENIGAKIVPINAPFPLSLHMQKLIDGVKQLIGAFIVLVPFTFMPANYVNFVVRERETKSKMLQYISGASPLAYWLATITWDFFLYAVSALLTVALLAAFKRDVFVGDADTTMATIALFLSYGLSVIPQGYVLSFAFSTNVSAQVTVLVFNFFFGLIMVLLSLVLEIPNATKAFNWGLKFLLRLFPSFAFGDGIITLTKRKLIAEAFGIPVDSAFAWGANQMATSTGGVATSLTFLLATAPLFFVLLVMAESGRINVGGCVCRRWRWRRRGHDVASGREVDESHQETSMKREEAFSTITSERDIAEERDRVASCETAVEDVHKTFIQENGIEVQAVRGVSFGVPKGEVFALLGPNGAGKSTVMGMVTGDIAPTRGDCRVAGHSIIRARNAAMHSVGYCPQYDPLLPFLTPRDHMLLHGGLRGLSWPTIDEEIERIFGHFDAMTYVDTPVDHLSGGTKRKVSLALALLGAPSLVLLDEPSAGYDPVARRALLSAITRLAQRSSVLLTTHHLEEVEALGDRVAIMVDGSIRCVGSLQHIKATFDAAIGYEIALRCTKPEYAATVGDAVSREFRELAPLDVDIHGATVSARVRVTPLSALIKRLQSLHSMLTDTGENSCRMVETYSVDQTTLERVFIKVAEGACPPPLS
jgi:ATP-binding cassette, subfamily A (ABC1), member 3